MAPAVRVPYVTYALIALNVAIFAVTALQSHSVADNHRGSRLFGDLALYPPLVARGEFVRLIGSGFLHYGPLHLLVNMFALYIVGRFVEAALGPGRYLAVYLVSLLGGSAAVMVFSQDTATAGASGAIFGLFGAQAAVLILLRQSPGPVLAVIFVNVVISVSIPGISVWGHIGGLVAGTLAGAGLLFGPIWFGNRKRQADPTVGWLAVVVVGLIAVGLIAQQVVQLRG